MSRKPKLACPESITDLWDGKRPSTARLFTAIAGEAFACLSHADWEARIRRIENILSVLKWRMRAFWEEQLDNELDKMVKKTKEGDSHVG